MYRGEGFHYKKDSRTSNFFSGGHYIGVMMLVSAARAFSALCQPSLLLFLSDSKMETAQQATSRTHVRQLQVEWVYPVLGKSQHSPCDGATHPSVASDPTRGKSENKESTTVLIWLKAITQSPLYHILQKHLFHGKQNHCLCKWLVSQRCIR